MDRRVLLVFIITRASRELPYDGLGYPNDHFEWCIENGLDAHAITEHGQMNSYAHAQLWIEDWKNKNPNRRFKYIPGCEIYFHPDLEQWRRDKQAAQEARTQKKLMLKQRKAESKLSKKIVAIVDKDDETEEIIIETANALTIENEDESKSNKFFNPVNRRHHMVVLPKNQKGLLSIFGAVSEGYLKGFYRFPRVDTGMLKEACKDGNVIVTSACIHPEARLTTNFGTLTIKEVVDRVNNNEEIQVLSCDKNDNSQLEFKKVTWGDVTRKSAKLLKIKLADGRTLKLTPDHKVKTDAGWIEAQNLTKKHRILAIRHN